MPGGWPRHAASLPGAQLGVPEMLGAWPSPRWAAAPQPGQFSLAQAAPDAVHLPGLDGKGQAFGADQAARADRLGPCLLVLAGPARGDREEQVGVGRQAGPPGTPVNVVTSGHENLAKPEWTR